MSLSMLKWNGCVAVVTGASSGIGAAIADKLVENGMKVIGLARRVERIEEKAKQLIGKGGELHALKVDIKNAQEVLRAFEKIDNKFGPIHILINNAGILRKSTLCGGNAEEWKDTFDTNVMGLCVATKSAIASMKKYGIAGHIVHMNSLAGHKIYEGIELNVYSASKYAVTALTETLRFELIRDRSKIKVTSISPGLVETPLIEASGLNIPPSTKLMKPDDIVDAVIYVLSTPPHIQVQELIINTTGSRY